MRYRGLAQPHGTFPPISQRPLRRATTYQGQERSRYSGRDQITGWLGASPRRGLEDFPLCQRARGFPQAGWRRVFPQPVAQGFLLPIDRGFPQSQKAQVFPSPGGSEFSSHYATRGFPSAAYFEVFPAPMGPRFLLAGFPLAGLAPGFLQGQRPQSPPNTGWSGVSPAPVARSFLLAGGAGLLLARKPEVVLCRVARGFPFAGYRPWW